MRILKFRGMDNNGDWFFGGVTEDKEYIALKFSFKGVRSETVGQFTGFYDKNSLEIYEGDVIDFGGVPFIVKWIDRIGRFIIENHMTFLTMSNSHNFIIMGNIHDNPTLFQNLLKEFMKNADMLKSRLNKARADGLNV